MERREFLTGCSAAAIVATTVSPLTLLDAESGRETTPPIERATFERLRGVQFRAYDGDGRFMDKLRLVEIHDRCYCHELDQFTLVFEGAYETALPEGIWRLTSAQHPAFLVALSSQTSGSTPRYTAAFNLLKSQRHA
jgi:hypothetical protein